MNKYHNKKAEINGVKFDSRKEAHRWWELSMLERAGKITKLRRQIPFVVIPAQRIDGKVVERECKYIADFVYEQDGKTVVEDTKGVRTPEYVIKRKLMLEKYGIQIQEV